MSYFDIDAVTRGVLLLIGELVMIGGVSVERVCSWKEKEKGKKVSRVERVCLSVDRTVTGVTCSEAMIWVRSTGNDERVNHTAVRVYSCVRVDRVCLSIHRGMLPVLRP